MKTLACSDGNVIALRISKCRIGRPSQVASTGSPVSEEVYLYNEPVSQTWLGVRQSRSEAGDEKRNRYVPSGSRTASVHSTAYYFVVITAPHFLHKLLGKFLGVYQQKARVSHTQTPIKETLYLLRHSV
jgi:hypothetical protein